MSLSCWMIKETPTATYRQGPRLAPRRYQQLQTAKTRFWSDRTDKGHPGYTSRFARFYTRCFFSSPDMGLPAWAEYYWQTTDSQLSILGNKKHRNKSSNIWSHCCIEKYWEILEIKDKAWNVRSLCGWSIGHSQPSSNSTNYSRHIHIHATIFRPQFPIWKNHKRFRVFVDPSPNTFWIFLVLGADSHYIHPSQ